ncbi:MAG: hypothetical protein J5I93_29330 [Pirellulaceae bacterium]|nr:hypothetical protein [Pirellulaceae bacterium]
MGQTEFDVGQRVRVLVVPLQGALGTVVQVLADQRLLIRLDAWDRVAYLETHMSQVERID